MATITVSLSTLLQLAGVGVLLAVLYLIYNLFYVRPKAFEKYWREQGVGGQDYKPPFGPLPDIQRAADSDRIVEYAQGMARRYGLLQTQVVGPLCQLVVYDPEVARYIFTSKAAHYHKASEWEKQIMRPLLHNGLLLSEDAYWKQQRALVSPGFHFWYLQEMVPIIVECVEAWIASAEARIDALGAGPDAEVELEMSHELATITLDSVATAAFGAGFREDPERADRFIHSLKLTLDNMQARTLNLLGFIPVVRDLPLPSLRAIKRGCAEIDRIVREIVADRKAGKSRVVEGGIHPGSQTQDRRRDLLDLLLDAQANMPAGQVLTDRGVEEESINFIAAGAETTSNLCIWMLWRIITEQPPAEGQRSVREKVEEELARVCGGANPDIEQLKELKYLESVAYEALRLHPPAPTIPKHAIETHSMKLSDGREITVPKGTTVLLNANVIHRLEEYWPNPDQFKPERFLSESGKEDDTPAASPSPSGSPAPEDSPQGSPNPASPRATLTAAEKARKAAQPFAFLGFSAGPRKCIGKNLAMMEIKIIFSLLLQRFSFRLVPDQYIAANAITRLPKNGIKFMVRRKQQGEMPVPAEVPTEEGAQKRANVTINRPLGMI